MTFHDKKSSGRGNSAVALGGGAPAFHLDQAAKRLFDIAAATAGLILFSPLVLITSIAIKLDSRGPILVREVLYGYKNRPTQVLGFRLVAVYPENDRTTPRLTRVGRILTQTGIDELPRLFNVLRGDMSIVGPPPGPNPRASLNRVKPGIVRFATRPNQT
jgi:lipopolysaccharide/colanic/teichoic acid biosynthesis glycosyltransferase